MLLRTELEWYPNIDQSGIFVTGHYNRYNSWYGCSWKGCQSDDSESAGQQKYSVMLYYCTPSFAPTFRGKPLAPPGGRGSLRSFVVISYLLPWGKPPKNPGLVSLGRLYPLCAFARITLYTGFIRPPQAWRILGTGSVKYIKTIIPCFLTTSYLF